MATIFDTIVAPITGSSRAAVAIVRLSGPEAWVIARSLFFPTGRLEACATYEPMRLYYGRFAHGDDGYLVLFEASRSYTGEPAAECSIHGSPASVKALVDLAIAGGARFAEPGEFTQRAFLNGRIDLTQAEAVRDTIEAETAAQLRIANRQREGALHAGIRSLRDGIVTSITAIEATVDFSEEIGELDRAAMVARLDEICGRLITFVDSAKRARLFREGMRVALIGPPNAGKSSLLNAILGTQRSIVTATPGTTRDYVEGSVDLEGLPVTFIDTAGLRESDDEVEQEGIYRALALAKSSDLALYLYDAEVGYSEEDSKYVARIDAPVWIFANKSDLSTYEGGARISAKTGDGIPELLAEIRKLAGEEPSAAVNPRHRQALALTLTDVAGAMSTLSSDRPVDLATAHLYSAAAHLGEITGENATPDIISRIFHDFCIGK